MVRFLVFVLTCEKKYDIINKKYFLKIYERENIVWTHNGDKFTGSYSLDRQKNLKFKISKSAQTALMNSEVYNSAKIWNNISSNVHITIIMETPGMPSIADCMGVYDGKGGTSYEPDVLEDSNLGLTQYYDAKGNPLDNNSNKIAFVKILINTNTPRYDQYFKDNDDKKRIAASMNFIHEVGHALMLAHPTQNSLLSDHTINGRPYAVMNKGLPNIGTLPQVSPVPTYHDKNCLIGKWGN